MRISRVIIDNYRNIKHIDIELSKIVALLGENNSGKSNILKAVTLPFLSDEIGYVGKNLVWPDINDDAKNQYYEYIIEHQELIKSDKIDVEDFASHLPKVSVEVYLEPKKNQLYFVKDLAIEVDGDKLLYGLLYEFSSKNNSDILSHVKEVLLEDEVSEKNLAKVKMNLLPINFYSHSIVVPKKLSKVSYDDLKSFKYTSLVAERDDFSNSNEKLGSKSLVNLLQMKLTAKSKITIEKEYSKFFETVKDLSEMETIINWQDNSEIENAKDFFDKISILPNMPQMNSLLSSVRLGFSDNQLSTQGLGYRNLILLLVLLNSLMIKQEDLAFSLLTMEEPEAHLCINNKRLMLSFIKSFMKDTNIIQLFYSTHSTEFINKLDFNSIVIVKNEVAYALSSELDETSKNYLSKNPNLDLYKLFLAKNCILVEGLTEELLIRSYLDSNQNLNDIEVISFHKGFTKIIDIWIKINMNSDNKLGIVRDFDDEPNPKKAHEKYNEYDNICVQTTTEYTLEPEIVSTGNNFELLNEYFEEKFEWEKSTTKKELSDKWRGAKAEVMLKLCKSLSSGELQDFEMPKHIQTILDFLNPKQLEEDDEN